MAVRIRDYFRNIVTGAGISGRTVSLKRHVDDVEIASTTTGSDGSFTLNDSDFSYRGPTYITINDGTRYKYHSGKTTGQVGPLWIDDLLRAFDNMGVGVISGLAVTAAGSTMNLSVAAGAAILKDGIPYTFSSAQTATVTTADPTNPRIDSLVIRGTRLGQTEEGNAVLTLIAGTAAGVPVAPSLTQTSATWDIWLADIRVDAAVSVIASNKVTDRRIFSAHLLPAVGATNDILTVVGGQWVPLPASVVASTITVSSNGSSLSSAINNLDLSTAFSASISPSNEANIGLATAGVAAINLASGAVTTAKIASEAVTTAEIGPLAVTTAKIAPGAVTATELGALAVTTAKINTGAVTATELGTNAVTGTKILDSAVTTTKIADANVTTTKILDSNVTAAKLATDSVTTVKITDANVTNAKVATGIDAVKLADGSVTNTEFQYIGTLTSNAQTQIDTKSDVTHFNGSILTGGAATGTNASASTYVSMFSENVSLPAGTWTLYCAFIGNYSNSVGGSGVTFRFSSPSVGSATNADTATANNLFAVNMSETFLSQTGNITVAGEYRAHTSGTATGGRWTLIIQARRTA